MVGGCSRSTFAEAEVAAEAATTTATASSYQTSKAGQCLHHQQQDIIKYKSINQSTNQPINQSTNQSINQSIKM